MKMLVVFVSNYYNHHQGPFINAMHRLTEGNFFFIENEKIAQERLNMGWGTEKKPEYVLQAYESNSVRKKCEDIIWKADIVLFENTAKDLVIKRLKKGKLTFLYSERCFKSSYELWKLPIRWFTWYKGFKNHYLLCASAFAAADYALVLNFIGKAYKWGYFPEVKKYDIDELMAKKLSVRKQVLKHSFASILWAGRLIEWKHPDTSIRVAASLKRKGYSFMMNIIGNGEMEQQLMQMIKEYQVEDCVKMLGSMTPDKVRKHMEQADIYLFTSDFNEGWGAVLNESMNSGCSVVASHAIGSVPFLIDNGENGLIYENNNEDDLLKKIEYLLNNPAVRKKMGIRAYETMQQTWNAEVAATRLIELSNDLIEKGTSERYDNGPCSKAEFLRNGWFKA